MLVMLTVFTCDIRATVIPQSSHGNKEKWKCPKEQISTRITKRVKCVRVENNLFGQVQQVTQCACVTHQNNYSSYRSVTPDVNHRQNFRKLTFSRCHVKHPGNEGEVTVWCKKRLYQHAVCPNSWTSYYQTDVDRHLGISQTQSHSPKYKTASILTTSFYFSHFLFSRFLVPFHVQPCDRFLRALCTLLHFSSLVFTSIMLVLLSPGTHKVHKVSWIGDQSITA